MQVPLIRPYSLADKIDTRSPMMQAPFYAAGVTAENKTMTVDEARAELEVRLLSWLPSQREKWIADFESAVRSEERQPVSEQQTTVEKCREMAYELSTYSCIDRLISAVRAEEREKMRALAAILKRSDMGSGEFEEAANRLEQLAKANR